MSDRLAHLTEAGVSARCSEASFDRGWSYYSGGAVRQRVRLDDGLETRGNLCWRCVGVLPISGKYITYLPEAEFDWTYIWYDWHPSENALAVLTKHCEERYRLFLWDVSAFQQ